MDTPTIPILSFLNSQFFVIFYKLTLSNTPEIEFGDALPHDTPKLGKKRKRKSKKVTVLSFCQIVLHLEDRKGTMTNYFKN